MSLTIAPIVSRYAGKVPVGVVIVAAWARENICVGTRFLMCQCARTQLSSEVANVFSANFALQNLNCCVNPAEGRHPRGGKNSEHASGRRNLKKLVPMMHSGAAGSLGGCGTTDRPRPWDHPCHET